MGDVLKIRPTNVWANRKRFIEQTAADVLHMLSTISDKSPLPINVELVCGLLGLRIQEVEEIGGVRLGNSWAERDLVVPAILDRVTRTVLLSSNRPRMEKRFSVAHEIGHLLLHSSPAHHRERVARSALAERARFAEPAPKHPEEREADHFAGVLLVPDSPCRDFMDRCFGGPIDGSVPRDELAHYLSLGLKRKISSFVLAGMPQEERAKLVAQAGSFSGRVFQPLCRVFDVSVECMAIRLVELGLVY